MFDTMRSLWQDDCGAVLTAEYLTLGSVVVLGGVSGLAAMSDSVNGEMREFGNSVRQMRQTYSARGTQSPAASRQASAAGDQGGQSAVCCESVSP
jgi:hypothetical protein